MPVASIARPITPPSASISRTRCPFAVPPTAGLHGMCATVSFDSVHRPTRQPSRAAAYAASTPACPAPITMTSKRIRLLPDAEALEDVAQHVLAGPAADDFVETHSRRLQIDQQEFFRHVSRVSCVACRPERSAALVEQRDAASIRNPRRIPESVLADERARDRTAQRLVAHARHSADLATC